MSSRKRKANNSINSKLKNKRKYKQEVEPPKQLSIPLVRCDQRNNLNEVQRNVFKYNSKTIDDMPTELLLKIFSYLTYLERKNISLVSKKWRIICSDPLLNRYFTVGPKIPLSKVREMLREAPYLKHFRIVMRKDLKSILNTLSKYNTNITNIRIEKCLECKVSTFIQLSNCCPGLKSLAINNTVVSYGRTFKCNTKVFEKLQKLTAVNSCVHNNRSNVDNRAVPLTTLFLIKLFQRCISLKYIKVSLSQIQPNLLKDGFVHDLCEMTNYNLIGLCLDATELTDESVEKISLCKNLKVLKLAYATKITIKSFEILKKVSTLRTLHLTNVKRVGRSTWNSLFNRPWMEHLQCLNLSGSKRVDDCVLRTIGKNCKSLTHLKLSKCKLITGDGLAYVIKGCKKLTNLNIKETRRKAAKSLSLIAEHLKKLTILACEKKHIQRRVKKQLIISCPNLVIK